MATYTNSYAEQIYNILISSIGIHMAQASLKFQCKKLGINEESIQKEYLPALAKGLKQGLIVFIGSDEAQKVADKIVLCRLIH